MRDREREEDFGRDFGPLFDALRASAGECPPADTLSGWQAGQLMGADSERVREHVGLCGECQWIVGRLAAAPDPNAPAAAPADKAGPGRLTDRMRDFLRGQGAPSPRAAPPLSGRTAWPRFAYAGAALALLIAAAAAYQAVRLRGVVGRQSVQLTDERERRAELARRADALAEQDRQSQAQIAALRQRLEGAARAARVYANPFSQALHVAPLRSPRADQALVIRMPAGAELLHLVIILPEPAGPRLYRVQITPAGGGAPAADARLERDDYGGLHLAIPRQALSAGEYVVKVYQPADGKDRPVAEQRFSITL